MPNYVRVNEFTHLNQQNKHKYGTIFVLGHLHTTLLPLLQSLFSSVLGKAAFESKSAIPLWLYVHYLLAQQSFSSETIQK